METPWRRLTSPPPSVTRGGVSCHHPCVQGGRTGIRHRGAHLESVFAATDDAAAASGKSGAVSSGLALRWGGRKLAGAESGNGPMLAITAKPDNMISINIAVE